MEEEGEEEEEGEVGTVLQQREEEEEREAEVGDERKRSPGADHEGSAAAGPALAQPGQLH